MAINSRMLGRSRLWLAIASVILSVLAIALCTARPADASTPTQTMYRYTSESGDYIGLGRTNRYKPANATISVSGTAESLKFSVETDSEWWYIDLAAPRGERLHPGRYYGAEVAAFRTGRAPGLDVYGNGRGCNRIWGNFAINQISTDSAGKVTMLDASFTQRCESSTAPALKGTVLFKAPPLSYSFRSDPGDYIGGGIAKKYLGATSTFSLSGNDNALQYSVSGRRDYWTALIAAPSGQHLRPGTYSTARAADASHARLDVFGNGRRCNWSRGTLTIAAITLDNGGKVTGLGATFEQRCHGDASALHGTIRYRERAGASGVGTEEWEAAARGDLERAAAAASSCAADNDNSYVNCASVAQLGPYGFAPTTGVVVNGMNGNASDWSAAMQHKSGGSAFTYATFGDSAGQVMEAARGSGAPALPDRTAEWEALVQSDLEKLAAAASLYAADNFGQYTGCTLAILESYGFEPSANVTHSITVAGVDRLVAQAQHTHGGSTFQYDTATGKIEPVTRS